MFYFFIVTFPDYVLNPSFLHIRRRKSENLIAYVMDSDVDCENALPVWFASCQHNLKPLYLGLRIRLLCGLSQGIAEASFRGPWLNGAAWPAAPRLASAAASSHQLYAVAAFDGCSDASARLVSCT
jgi:hypothetical protein